MNLVLEMESLGATWRLTPEVVIKPPSGEQATMLRLELSLPNRNEPIRALFSPLQYDLSAHDMLALAIKGHHLEDSFNKRWKFYCGDVPVACSITSPSGVAGVILGCLAKAPNPVARALHQSLLALPREISQSLWKLQADAINGELSIQRGEPLRRWVALSSLEALRFSLREHLEEEDLPSEREVILILANQGANQLSYQEWMHNALATLLTDKQA